jgi:hypothetical protein
MIRHTIFLVVGCFTLLLVIKSILLAVTAVGEKKEIFLGSIPSTTKSAAADDNVPVVVDSAADAPNSATAAATATAAAPFSACLIWKDDNQVSYTS